MISAREAQLVMRKWKDENALVRVLLNSSEVSLDLECHFLKVGDDLSLDVGQGTEAIQIGWPDFSFEYSEPNSTSEIVPDKRGRFYSAGLMGTTKSGRRIYLFRIEELEKD